MKRWEKKRFFQNLIMEKLLLPAFILAVFLTISSPVWTADTGWIAPFSGDENGSWNSQEPPDTDPADRWSDEEDGSAENDNEVGCINVGGALLVGGPYYADHSWSGFDFSATLGSNDAVAGIEVVIVDGRVSDAGGTDKFHVTLYTKNDSGAHNTWDWWGDTKSVDVETQVAGTNFTFGGATDQWGLTNPTGADFGPKTTFKVKVKVQTGAKTDNFYFDHIKVKIYYSTSAVNIIIRKWRELYH